MGEGSFFTGSCLFLGVGTVYVTSLENSAVFLFGVEVANFIFRRRVAFLFRVAAAYVMGGAILGDFSPLVLVKSLVVELAGMVATELSSPLVMMHGASFLVYCHRVRIVVAYLVEVLRLHCRGPPQRLI